MVRPAILADGVGGNGRWSCLTVLSSALMVCASRSLSYACNLSAFAVRATVRKDSPPRSSAARGFQSGHQLRRSKCCYQACLLKKSLLGQNHRNLGDRKCLGDPSKSIVGLPDAILFSSILRDGVFQQTQALALIENSSASSFASLSCSPVPSYPSAPGPA